MLVKDKLLLICVFFGVMLITPQYLKAQEFFLNYEGNVMDIKSRTLQIWSKKDPFIGEVVQKKMSSYNKDHKVASLDTDSHWPHLSLPEVVYRKIENFIGE